MKYIFAIVIITVTLLGLGIWAYGKIKKDPKLSAKGMYILIVGLLLSFLSLPVGFYYGWFKA